MNRGLLVLMWLLGGAGCSVLPPAEPVSLYRLPPATLAGGDNEVLLNGLRLARPQATGVLNGNRLLVLTGQQSYQAYGGVRWAAPLPVLWQDWLLDALWQNGHLGGLSREEEGIAAEWELSGTLRAFEVDLGAGRQQAVIRFDAQLLRTRDRHLVASRRFEQREPVENLNADTVVMAMGRAADRLVLALSQWLLDSGRGEVK